MPILMLNGKPYGSKVYDKSNNYSTEEQVIGAWIDGKPLYQKTIDIGDLPNTKTKSYDLPSNCRLITDISGYCVSSNGAMRPLPFPAESPNMIRIDASKTTLNVVTYADWSSYSGQVTIQYTKTTD